MCVLSTQNKKKNEKSVYIIRTDHYVYSYVPGLAILCCVIRSITFYFWKGMYTLHVRVQGITRVYYTRLCYNVLYVTVYV